MMQDEFDEDGEELLFEGAQCCRCDLDLDPRTGMCPNDRCPFHGRYQDEIVRWSPLARKRSGTSGCFGSSPEWASELQSK